MKPGSNPATPSAIASKAIACFAIIYITSYACISFMAYTPYWYKASCHIHPRCEKFGMDNAYRHIDEMAAYLRNSGELESTFWSDKERRHLAEVRPIYRGMAWVFVFTLLLFLYVLKRNGPPLLYSASKINIIVIIALLCLTPWFNAFWKQIHPYFFDNRDWLNTPREVSFWITPRYHFKYSAILLGSILAAVHIGLLLAFRKAK